MEVILEKSSPLEEKNYCEFFSFQKATVSPLNESNKPITCSAQSDWPHKLHYSEMAPSLTKSIFNLQLQIKETEEAWPQPDEVIVNDIIHAR